MPCRFKLKTNDFVWDRNVEIFVRGLLANFNKNVNRIELLYFDGRSILSSNHTQNALRLIFGDVMTIWSPRRSMRSLRSRVDQTNRSYGRILKVFPEKTKVSLAGYQKLFEENFQSWITISSGRGKKMGKREKQREKRSGSTWLSTAVEGEAGGTHLMAFWMSVR